MKEFIDRNKLKPMERKQLDGLKVTLRYVEEGNRCMLVGVSDSGQVYIIYAAEQTN